MENSADLGGFYPPRPSASVDKTLVDLENSSYPIQPHLSVYDRHIFGSSSVVFDKLRKMLGNVLFSFKTILENLRKSSESGRKSSENRRNGVIRMST